uniref:Uncharacterized protein n=1 Tax=Anguilla anguilla TaxID=7936 RepID=A0A0E9WPR3_ANGAN
MTAESSLAYQGNYPACNTENVIVWNASRNAHSLPRLENPDIQRCPEVPADQRVRKSEVP